GSRALCRAEPVPGARRQGRRARLRRPPHGAGATSALGLGADGAGRSSPGGAGPASKHEPGLARVALSRAGAGLSPDGVAVGERAGRGAALGGDVDRGGRRQGGLDGVSRPGSRRAEGLDRGQAGRAGGGKGRSAAADLVALGSVAAKPRRAERKRRRVLGREEVAYPVGQGANKPQACAADMVMLPRLLPMLAVPAAPFDSPEYGFEIKWDGIRALASVEAAGWRSWGRQRAEYTERYPELDVLRRLPAGTLGGGGLGAVGSGGRPRCGGGWGRPRAAAA